MDILGAGIAFVFFVVGFLITLILSDQFSPPGRHLFI